MELRSSLAVGLLTLGIASAPIAVEAQEVGGNPIEAADGTEPGAVEEFQMSLREALMEVLVDLHTSRIIKYRGADMYQLTNDDLLLIEAIETCFTQRSTVALEVFLRGNPDYMLHPNLYVSVGELVKRAEGNRDRAYLDRTDQFPGIDEESTAEEGLMAAWNHRVADILAEHIDLDGPFNTFDRGGVRDSNGMFYDELVRQGHMSLPDIADIVEERGEIISGFALFHRFENLGSGTEAIEFRMRLIPFLAWNQFEEMNLDYVVLQIINSESRFPSDELKLAALQAFLEQRGHRRGLKFPGGERGEVRDAMIESVQDSRLKSMLLRFPVRGETPQERIDRMREFRLYDTLANWSDYVNREEINEVAK